MPLWKSVVSSGLLLLISVAVALGSAEFLVRVVSPQQLIMVRPDIWSSVDTLGWQHASNLNTHVNTGERTVRFLTDAEGFRVGPAGRRSGSDSILLIGDSFMAALQVEYGQSLAGLIEDSLAGPNGQSVAVRNAGVGSWDPWHYLLFGRRRLQEHSYALNLVAVFVGNDVVSRRIDHFSPRQLIERPRFRVPLTLSAEDWIEGIARPVNDFLEQRSHLFVLVKNRTESLRIRLGLSPAYVPSVLLRSRAAGEQWSVTADILAELAQIAASADVPTLFVLIPARYQVERELFSRHAEAFDLDRTAVDLNQPNDSLRSRLEARGLTVVDALVPFREATREGLELYGRVDSHLSPTGHRVLFDLLEGHVRKQLGWRDSVGES